MDFFRILHGDDGDEDAAYNLDMQIAGIFIIIGCSSLGVLLSLGVARIKNKTFIAPLLLFMKSLGAGIVIGTACIHLIGEAPEYFELAPGILNSEVYEAWPYVFVQIGLLTMSLVDFFIARSHFTPPLEACEREEGLIDMGHGHGGPTTTDSLDLKHNSSRKREHVAIAAEISVLLHSVLIGFNLGIQNSSTYDALLVAISFHQFFEGFALGQIILDANISSPVKKWLMVVGYSFTTGIGICIGIAVHESYDDEESPGLNAMIGILDSLCGGVLLYLGLVSMCNIWITHNVILHDGSIKLGALAYFGLVLGMAVMALIGNWA